MDSYEFTSYEHDIRRKCNSCNRCDQEEPKFEIGIQSTCWRPSIADITSIEGKLSNWYRCGNDYCIKILSPQDDEDRARYLAYLLFLLGVIILPVSIVLLLGAYWIYKKCGKKNNMEKEEEEKKNNNLDSQDTYNVNNMNIIRYSA